MKTKEKRRENVQKGNRFSEWTGHIVSQDPKQPDTDPAKPGTEPGTEPGKKPYPGPETDPVTPEKPTKIPDPDPTKIPEKDPTNPDPKIPDPSRRPPVADEIFPAS